MKLDSIIALSPGFKTAVNLKTDLDHDAKVSSYIPTEAASEFLFDVGQNLHPLAGRRSRLLTGTYGTGKSHLALVVARIYRDGITSPAITPVLDKLAKWPGKREKLTEERAQLNCKFLLVLMEGDEGPFDDSLLRHLDDALRREGMADLLPETAFDAALARITEIREQDLTAFTRLEEAGKDFGFHSMVALEGQLKSKVRSAYDKFCEVHRAVFAGAPFYHYHLMTPREVYSAVAKRLVEGKGYAGIVVIWDEFGRYMERVVDDPRGIEGQSIQSFAEACCNSSGRNQVHLYLICHRSLQEYVGISAIGRTTGVPKGDQDEWHKVSGRFREFHMKSTDREVFDLIDQVIIQKDSEPVWSEFVNASVDYLDEWTDKALRLRLFPGLGRSDIHSTVTIGSYPLHPMAAFCLPRISQQVAQNERTLFTFLSDSGSDTLGPFIHETGLPVPGRRPPFFPADRLWDFFSPEVAKQPLHRRVYIKFNQADTLVPPDDRLGKRIIKALALLMVIGTDLAPCTEELIGFSLGLAPSEQGELRDKLKSLCGKEGNRDRVLVQTIADGAYRFTGSPSDDFEAKIEKLAQERLSSFSPAGHLRQIATELSLPSSIPATGYSDDFVISRSLTMQLVDCLEIQKPDTWLRNLGAGAFVDGYALVVLCEDGQEIRKAREIADTILKHPQIMVGIPKEPVHIAAILRRHDAIRNLERLQGNLYGQGADLREEWEQQDRDYLDAIGKVILPLLNPEKRLLDWIVDGQEVASVGTVSRLRGIASEIMHKVYPSTPRVAHDRLTTEDGKDNFVGARRAIISKLFTKDGPELLAKETASRDKTIIDAVYRKNGILQTSANGFTLDEPKPDTYPNMNAVWREIEKQIDAAKHEPVPMVALVSALRKPPYGMRTRSISLMVAAVFRKYVLRGNLSFGTSTTRVTKIDGTVLDDAIVSADKYRLVFTDIGQKQEAILFGVATAFNLPFSAESDKGELIELLRRAIANWWRGLPPFAQRTRVLDKRTIAIRERILKTLAQDNIDAQDVLLNTVADAIHPADDRKIISQDAIAQLFGDAKTDIDASVQKYLEPGVKAVVAEVFSPLGHGPASSEDVLSHWYGALPKEKRDTRIAGDATTLARVAGSVEAGKTPASVGALDLAKEITGAPLGSWGDDMLDRFRGRLEGAKKAVEEAEVASVRVRGNGQEVVLPAPKEGQITIVVSGDGEAFRRTFVPVLQISQMGENLRAFVKESIQGIGRTLPSGERETILIDIVRDVLR